MDELLQHPEAKIHTRLRGLVRESDVAKLAEVFGPWFRINSAARDSAKTVDGQTVLGPALLGFYQEGKKQQSSYVENFVSGDKWRTTTKRKMPQSVVSKRQKTLGKLKWTNKDFHAFFQLLGITKSGKKKVLHNRFHNVVAYWQSLNPSAESPEKRARVTPSDPPLKDREIRTLNNFWSDRDKRTALLRDSCRTFSDDCGGRYFHRPIKRLCC